MSSNESAPINSAQLGALERAAQGCHINALGLSFGELQAQSKFSIVGSKISLAVTLGLPIGTLNDELHSALVMVLKPLTAGCELHIDIKSDIPAGRGNGKTQALPGVKNIIAIASGKGGVGKSATALNLALALRAQGANVGLLDADIYGPSQPTMLGVPSDTRPEVEDKKYFLPVMAHGLQTMSMGYMVTEKTPMAWRGPMVSGALMQMIGQTRWNDLDYLLIDMPPGTGDIQLTLAQQVPCTGCVIVTTPQNIALLDARKGIEMFQKGDSIHITHSVYDGDTRKAGVNEGDVILAVNGKSMVGDSITYDILRKEIVSSDSCMVTFLDYQTSSVEEVILANRTIENDDATIHGMLTDDVGIIKIIYSILKGALMNIVMT